MYILMLHTDVSSTLKYVACTLSWKFRFIDICFDKAGLEFTVWLTSLASDYIDLNYLTLKIIHSKTGKYCIAIDGKIKIHNMTCVPFFKWF